MGRPAQDITESELAVLRILWDRGTATIRQLTDVLYPQGEAAQYATVQKLLDRMEAKGYVRRDRTMFVHVFRSVLDRDELIGRRLRSLAETLCEGSLTPLLTHLARAQDLTDEDRLALRAIFDESDPDNVALNVDHGNDSVVCSLVETLSGARSAPAAASATSGSGHVSCLKRRLRMIVRAKTPKGLSWAGRLAVLGMAALLLPLAPSWAHNDESTTAEPNRLAGVDESDRSVKTQPSQRGSQRANLAAEDRVGEDLERDHELAALAREHDEIRKRLTGIIADPSAPEMIQELKLEVAALTKKKEKQAPLFKVMQVGQKETNGDTFEATYLNHQVNSLMIWEEQVRKNLEQLTFEAGQARLRVRDLTERYKNVRNQKHNELLALLTNDDDKKKDDDKEEKTRDAAQRFQEQLTDLIGKLGERFGPVTEEIRKALDRAVGEVHQSLDKENLSVEELRKALGKSQDELKKAFEGGGPVDKELREAIEHSRKELEEALERGKAEVKDQVETLLQRSRELADQARENLERAKEAAEKGVNPEADGQPDREELETARKEIRELEQQLRRSTRRLEELQRRELRRNQIPRRERDTRGGARPQATPTPGVEPVPPEPPREPTAPSARPTQPSMRRPQPPARPGPGGGRRGPQGNSERRIQELEEKMKGLLKELETIKEDKTPAESPDSGAREARPARPGLPVPS